MRLNNKDKAEAIIKMVCDHERVSKRAITGPSQTRRDSMARKIVVYLVRQLTDLTYDQIGGLIGRTHSTAIQFYKEMLEEKDVEYVKYIALEMEEKIKREEEEHKSVPRTCPHCRKEIE